MTRDNEFGIGHVPGGLILSGESAVFERNRCSETSPYTAKYNGLAAAIVFACPGI